MTTRALTSLQATTRGSTRSIKFNEDDDEGPYSGKAADMRKAMPPKFYLNSPKNLPKTNLGGGGFSYGFNTAIELVLQ